MSKQSDGKEISVKVIAAWLPDALKELPAVARINFLHIDLNCAQAEVRSFEEAVARGLLTDGCTVVLDDYGYAGGGESYVEWNKFAGKAGLDILSLPTGQGLFTYRG